MGNLASVLRALRTVAHTGATVSLTNDPDLLRRADKLVFPGQGAFRECADHVEHGLREVVLERIRAGTPFLGICLGMQILFDSSEEAPGVRGLGVFAGSVRRLAAGGGLKVPHMGWNLAIPSGAGHRVLPGDPRHFYFVHSYACVPEDPAVVLATTPFGAPFASVVGRDDILGVQFHPEKSQQEGLALLERWVAA
jgi:glutamine amidotransferase